jgi:UDP-GlcNAc3NAcA epimerase
MSGVFFTELEIPEPKYNLGISSLSHGAMTGRMIEQLEKILLDEKPDIVLLYGDTNSTLAGALGRCQSFIFLSLMLRRVYGRLTIKCPKR